MHWSTTFAWTSDQPIASENVQSKISITASRLIWLPSKMLVFCVKQAYDGFAFG